MFHLRFLLTSLVTFVVRAVAVASIDSRGAISVVRREQPHRGHHGQAPNETAAETPAPTAADATAAPATGDATTGDANAGGDAANPGGETPTGENPANPTGDKETTGAATNPAAAVTGATGGGAPGGLLYEFVDEKLRQACTAHYEQKGTDLSVEDCAKACYETDGCARFSAGKHCKHGCRVSVMGSKQPDGSEWDVDATEDGQCATGFKGDDETCVVYKLAFFHAVKSPQSCSAHFVRKGSMSQAACAHECKKTPGCKRFTADPDCLDGCKISKCGDNHQGVPCPANKQCITDPGSGCTLYELFSE